MARIFYLTLWTLVIYGAIFIADRAPKWFMTPTKTLDFFCWGDTIEPEMLEEFEKMHGIRVRVNFFNSNEEMIVKLKAVKGRGYDVICVSEYAIRILKDEGLLAPLKPELIANKSAIVPYLLDQPFDPKNQFSLPIEWEPYVFVSREKNALKISDLFSDPGSKRLVMTCDPIEAICFAAYSLYGQVESLNKDQLLAVNQLLKKQKSWVEAYVDHRAKYLIESGNCDLALIRSGFAFLMEKDNLPIHYSLPNDWHFVNIESVAVTSASTKNEDAHKFIDFLLSHRFQKVHSSNTLVFSSREDLTSGSKIAEEVIQKKSPQFFRYLCKEEEARDLWISLKGHNP